MTGSIAEASDRAVQAYAHARDRRRMREIPVPKRESEQIGRVLLGVGGENVGESEDAVEGSAQLVAHALHARTR
eukprot:3553584-Rhodomonas_salina.2